MGDIWVGARTPSPVGEGSTVGEFGQLCRNFELNHLKDDLNAPGFFPLYYDQS